MAIKAYVGRMGSGKTYEVVTGIILGGLRRGRRVVSNIAGLNYEVFKQVLMAEGIAETDIGELVQIDHEKVLDPYFWRSDKSPEEKQKASVEEGRFLRKVKWFAETPKATAEVEAREYFVQPGDLVALDEIWRFWEGFGTKDGDGAKRPATVMNFFRMHRHFTHPKTGVACDVALITQDVMDISRSVRAVIEETYYMEKLTAIGSTKRYRVDIFQGGKTSGRPLRQLQRSYDSRFFPLYSSHSQKKEGDADAREENIDQRGNILKGVMFKVILPVGVVVMGLAVYTVMSFFSPKAKDVKPGNTGDTKIPDIQSKAGISQAKSSVELSTEWRAAGYYSTGAGLSVVLLSEHGSRILRNPPNVKLSGAEVESFLPGGEAVASWTGTKRGSVLPGSK